MPKDKRDLVELLKSELMFLEKGGYRQSLRAPWRTQFIFEESPTCINYARTEGFLPCSKCPLMEFVPPDCREEKIPCRHIPLNKEGYTVDTYNRIGTHKELEGALANWLRETIRRLEQERAERSATSASARQALAAGQ